MTISISPLEAPVPVAILELASRAAVLARVNLLDHHGGQLDHDVRACVAFFLWDPWAMFRALRVHTRGVNDRCVDRCGPWPCVSYTMAAYAERVYHAQRLKQVPPVSDADAPFRAAVRANATETTVPLRAVSRSTPTASGISGRSTMHGKENQR